MAIISSHVLDSVIGTHGAGIRVECYRLDGATEKSLVFDVIANEEGRIVEAVVIDESHKDAQYELVFHSAAYFAAQAVVTQKQIMDTIVVRIRLHDADARYHIPLVLSPHSYTIWWSG